MPIAEILKLTSSVIDLFEAELLLAHVLGMPRSFVHTWSEKPITQVQENYFLTLVEKRKSGMPIAYLIGKKGFWSLDLTVTSDVLIPRPETELLVELALAKINSHTAVVADLGTGSGAIALALAAEKPSWTIYATDESEAALAIAKKNAHQLNLAHIEFSQGNWFSALPPLNFDAIISNPPYIDPLDEHLKRGDLRFEPNKALVSENSGLLDLEKIIFGAKQYLRPQGYLMVEHGYRQGSQVATFFSKAGYTLITQHQDLAGLDRVTIGAK